MLIAPSSAQDPKEVPSRRGSLRRSVPVLLASGVLLVRGVLADAQTKDRKDSQPVTDTLIKVTTFSEIGATLRGATVKLLPADKNGNPVKGKARQGVTNNMGEYPFLVPKAEATYVLRAEAKGFVTTDKVVTAHGEDQLDVFLQLPVRK